MNPEKLYLEIINNLFDGVYIVDTEKRITFSNKAAEDITGYAEEEIVGKRCDSTLLNHIDVEGRPLCFSGCPLHATIIDGQRRKSEVFLRHKDGHRVHILINIFPIREDDKIVGAIEVFSQRSPIVFGGRLLERLSDLAMNDPLTGLANRRKIESYLDFNFREMKRYQNKICVVFLDIDNFGTFNDTYGHETGDEVLRSVSKSVMRIIRKNDLFGRWGGEEFIGVFEIKNDSEAAVVAEKIRELISKTGIPHGDGLLSVTASLGVTVARAEDTIESVINRADALMYRSKESGKNRITSDV